MLFEPNRFQRFVDESHQYQRVAIQQLDLTANIKTRSYGIEFHPLQGRSFDATKFPNIKVVEVDFDYCRNKDGTVLDYVVEVMEKMRAAWPKAMVRGRGPEDPRYDNWILV